MVSKEIHSERTDNSTMEGNKLLYDTLKHLTTLCTGSIIILVAFLEKIFLNAEWKFLVSITV